MGFIQGRVTKSSERKLEEKSGGIRGRKEGGNPWSSLDPRGRTWGKRKNEKKLREKK